MKLSRTCIAIFAGASLAVVSAQGDANSTAAAAAAAALQQMEAALPACALGCLSTIVPQYCALTNATCICTNSKLAEASTACLAANCTITQSLATERYQKTSCGVPVRNESSLTRSISWAFFGLAAASVALRFLARSSWMGGAGLWWDDWTILLCMALLAPANTILDLMTRSGLGQDIWMLKPEQITRVLFYFWIQEFIYISVIMATKISILLLYLRIFPDTVSVWFRRACFVVIGLCTAFWFAAIFSTAFECTPVSLAWLKWDGQHTGHCFNTEAQIFANAGINIALDLLVFFLPFPKLVKLDIPKWKKVGILATFAVGLFVTACSITRLQYLVQWGSSTNPTWDYNRIGIWSCIEGNATVICACMPSMAGIIKKFWKQTIGSMISSRSSGSRKYPDRVPNHIPDDVEHSGAHRMPSSGISKTQMVSAEYDARTTSSANEELELVDKSTYQPSLDKRLHTYSREWSS